MSVVTALAGIALLGVASPAFAGGDLQEAVLTHPNAGPLQRPAPHASSIPLVNVSVVGGNDRRHDSRGTGFLVGRDTWATAAHVVRGCAAVYVRGDKGWSPARKVSLHPSVDIAVITAHADEGQAFLPLADKDPAIGQPGVHLGYAHGRLVFVETSLSAAANIYLIARPEAGASAGWYWRQRGEGVQDSRLNGVSGGPQIDANGNVQGITISYAGDPIRMTTVPAAALRGFLPASVQLADPRSSNRIADRSGATAVPQFAASAGVTSIYCAVSARTRPAS